MLSITFKMSNLLKAMRALEPYKRPVSLWKLPQPAEGQESLFTVSEQYEQILISPVLGVNGRASLSCYNQERRLKTRVEIPVKAEGGFSKPLYLNYWAVKSFAAQYKNWPELTINHLDIEDGDQFLAEGIDASLIPK